MLSTLNYSKYIEKKCIPTIVISSICCQQVILAYVRQTIYVLWFLYLYKCVCRSNKNDDNPAPMSYIRSTIKLLSQEYDT